jgi:AcrR family transcriptional regulator
MAARNALRRRLSLADRRAAILRSALEVFAERGFHEASLEDVAARDGISKALIYEHFASKRDLQRDLLETYVHEGLERVTDAAAAAETAEERLHAGIDAFLAFVEERPDAWRMVALNVGDPDAAEATRRLQEEVVRMIGLLLAVHTPASRRGEPDLERTIEMLAELLYGAMYTFASWWVDHLDIPRERAVATIMDFAWTGLERVSAGERWRTATIHPS